MKPWYPQDANPIVQSRILGRSSMLYPRTKRETKHKTRGWCQTSKPRNSKVVEHVGLNLVAWHIEQGQLKEAEELLCQIAGKEII